MVAPDSECNDCAIALIQQQLKSPVYYDDHMFSRYEALTQYCSKTGFPVTKPTTTMKVVPV